MVLGSYARFEERSMVLSKATIVEALFAKHIFTRTQSAQTMDTLSEMIEKSLQEE